MPDTLGSKTHFAIFVSFLLLLVIPCAQDSVQELPEGGWKAESGKPRSR